MLLAAVAVACATDYTTDDYVLAMIVRYLGSVLIADGVRLK